MTQDNLNSEKIPVYEIYQGETKVGVFFNEELAAEVNNFLNKRKKSKPKIEIPQFAVVKYNEMFPKIKSKKTGKYLRCNITEVSKSFERFFKDYQYDWNTIFEATYLYIQEEEVKNYEWTVRSKYFVSKLKDSTVVSELAEYCERIVNGENFEEEKSSFEPKVY